MKNLDGRSALYQHKLEQNRDKMPSALRSDRTANGRYFTLNPTNWRDIINIDAVETPDDEETLSCMSAFRTKESSMGRPQDEGLYFCTLNFLDKPLALYGTLLMQAKGGGKYGYSYY